MQTAKRNRFQLKGSKPVKEVVAAAQDQEQMMPLVVKYQQEKLNAILDFERNTKVREQLTHTERILKAPVEDYEQILTQMRPESSYPTKHVVDSRKAPSMIKDVQPRSLAEAQLLSRYQVMNVECQNLMGSILPLIVETYKLQQLRKQSEAGADLEHDEHNLEKQVIAFSNAVQPKIAPIVQHCASDFVREAEEALLSTMQNDEIAQELESQELCLLKHDYLRDLKAATEIQTPQQRLVEVLETANSFFPLQSSREKIKQQAMSRLIPTSLAQTVTHNPEASVDGEGNNMAQKLSAKLEVLKQKALKRRQELLEDLL